jgi:excisionase family DNA binding protein
MNEFGQKGKVPLSERLSVSPEEASALTGIGLTSIREAISSGDLKAKKHGRRTIILPDDLRVWLKALPDAGGWRRPRPLSDSRGVHIQY